MTECNREPLLFSSLNRQEVVADFDGGRLTSNGGGLLLRDSDRALDLTGRLAACLTDPRDPARIVHQQQTMLAQRVQGMALGYEDLNDHDTLGDDPLMAVLVDKRPAPEEPLAWSPMLCRFENRLDRRSLARMAEVFAQTFIASRQRPPQQRCPNGWPSRSWTGRNARSSRPVANSDASTRSATPAAPGMASAA